MTRWPELTLQRAVAAPCQAPPVGAARAWQWAVVTCTALLLAACLPMRPAAAGAAGVEFVIVRHAEKRSDDPRDPLLTEAGPARAQRLASSLAGQPLAAVYATAYRRTQLTAAPSAAAHGVAVTTYDAKQDARTFAATLKQRHRSGTVLVVGHSNTVPDIAAALCECIVAPIGDGEFDRRLSVGPGSDGKATLVDTRTP